MRIAAILLFVFCLVAGPLAAQFDPRAPIPDGRCVLVVASRPSVDDSRAYIAGMAQIPPFTQVFPSSNGWYAITVGSLTTAERDATMARWKAQGRIPQDSFCTFGADFGPALDWRIAGAGREAARQGPRLVNGRLEVPNADGTVSLRDLADGTRRTRHPDGVITGTQRYSNVDYIGMPSLTGGFARWVTDVDDRIDALAADILDPEEIGEFAVTGRDRSYEGRILLRLQVLEIIAEDRR